MDFNFTERQVRELVAAMQYHACNLDEEVRQQSNPDSPHYHCQGKDQIKIMANDLKVSRNILEKLIGDRHFY